MKEVIITIVALCSMQKFDEVVSKIRYEKLRYALNFIMYAVVLGASIYFKMKVLCTICIVVILSDVLKIIVIARWRKRSGKELEEEQRKQDERDGVVYTLKETEYREIN